MPDIETALSLVRHPGRPNAKEYIERLFPDFLPLGGDRLHGEDPAVLGGMAMLDACPVTVIGQIRGRNLEENLCCGFSMPRPEGYRKALRLMKQAEKFRRPVICFIDTPGAYPGRDAEERGQGGAIADCLQQAMNLRTPIVSVLIGEGGSGGALALCIADEVAALENATLSVISPKGCAAILWKDSSRAGEAARLLRMTAEDLLAFGVVDFVLPEPEGGAHVDPQRMALHLRRYLIHTLRKYRKIPAGRLVRRRNTRYRRIGV